jgi:histidinol dehydrogenase
LASAVLLTDSETIAAEVQKEIRTQIDRLDRKDIAEQSLAEYGLVAVVPDIKSAVDLANRVAPEHLELMIENPFEYINMIRNAGAVFMGDYTPEPVGDYMAGPNHVLPTGGTARFSSALSVDHFMKKTSLIHYSRQMFRKEASDIMRLAEIEGLGAHAESVNIRIKTK